MTIIHPDDTIDGQTRIEISPRCACRNRRTFGFMSRLVVITIRFYYERAFVSKWTIVIPFVRRPTDIPHVKSDKTFAPYNLTAAVKLVLQRENELEFAHVWGRVVTCTSNCLTTEGTSVQVGTVADAVLVASFGCHLTETFCTRGGSSLDEWRREGLGPALPTSQRDLGPWSWSSLPIGGGSGFATTQGSIRITGLHVPPPLVDVHTYHERTHARANDTPGAGPSSKSPRNSPSVSISKLAAMTYGKVRLAPKEEGESYALEERKSEWARSEERRSDDAKRREESPLSNRLPPLLSYDLRS